MKPPKDLDWAKNLRGTHEAVQPWEEAMDVLFSELERVRGERDDWRSAICKELGMHDGISSGDAVEEMEKRTESYEKAIGKDSEEFDRMTEEVRRLREGIEKVLATWSPAFPPNLVDLLMVNLRALLEPGKGEA